MTAQPILFFLTRWNHHINAASKPMPIINIPSDTWDEFIAAVKDCIPGPTDDIEEGGKSGEITLMGITFMRLHVTEIGKALSDAMIYGMGVHRISMKHIPFRKIHTPAPMHKRKAK